MTEDSPTEMPTDRRNEFLGSGGTGVLSLSAGEGPPHTVPVSYGYDASAETFYFRLAASPDASKGPLDGRPVSFVTYDHRDQRYHSVVASGHLEDVESEGIATETLAGLDRVEIPLVDIFESPTREVEFEFYRLVPEELTGRVEDPRDA